MTMICFMVSVSVLQSASVYVYEYRDDSSSAATLQDIDEYWSSVATCMLSLVMASTGGQDWIILSDPLKRIGSFPYGVFLLFIAIFNFVILNVVNSIFLEAMMSHSQRDNQFVIDTMIEERDEYIEKLQIVYDEIDDDGDGEITLDEFLKHTESPELLAFVSSMDIDIAGARHFFRVLSCDGRVSVDIQTFVDGCMKLKGSARSLDLLDLLYQHKASALEINSALKVLQADVSRLLVRARPSARVSTKLTTSQLFEFQEPHLSPAEGCITNKINGEHLLSENPVSQSPAANSKGYPALSENRFEL
jgi:hypothetical protein